MTLVENPELSHSTNNHSNLHQLNGHQPDANFTGAYHHPNYAGYGHWAQYHGSPYRNIPRLEGPPPAAEMYPNMLVPPGPSRGAYYVPPAHVRSLSVTYQTAESEVTRYPCQTSRIPSPGAFQNPAPSGMSVMDDMKRLADRYLHNPGSQVNILRMGLSPSSDRLRVMIVLDIDF
ncbi:hypothetical protein H4582DRAFT_2094478 [Lactarius indigo]|nr:hypothetical protein H4582DRAFT_2094478 [Lactarius indigo]